MSMRWKSAAAAIGRFMVFVANARQLREGGRRAPPCVAATAPERGRARIPPGRSRPRPDRQAHPGGLGGDMLAVDLP